MDFEDDEDEDAEGEEEELPPHPGSLFRTSRANRGGNSLDDLDAEMEKYIEDDMAMDNQDDEEEEEEEEEEEDDEEEDAEGEDEEDYDEDDAEGETASEDDGDLFLNMRHDDRAYGQPIIDDDPDLMLNDPVATERMVKEAESIFKRSARQRNSLHRREFQFATVATDLYSHQEPARLTEPPALILQTEKCVNELYSNGVGAAEDGAKLESELCTATANITSAWNEAAKEVARKEGEEYISVGPGPDSHPLEKAAYVARLILRMHHNRFESDGFQPSHTSLPAVLFSWMGQSHNPYKGQADAVKQHNPTPAAHPLYWQTLRMCLLRGDVANASTLLTQAGFDSVRSRPRGPYAYTGQALENVTQFAQDLGDLLKKCPAISDDWDIFNSAWSFFRVQARGSLDRLKIFAEGGNLGASRSDVYGSQASMSRMTRQAASQLPWDIYENLQTLYSIVLGEPETIIDTTQDWCEATVALCGWWDSGRPQSRNLKLSQSQALILPGTLQIGSTEYYLNRAAAAFHLTVRANFSPNPQNAVEIALACCFEGNVNAVIGFLRTWSLPMACTVAEIASLGNWLPAPVATAQPLTMDNLDADDMALLGITQPTTDETEGIKDTTLVLYARELAGIEYISSAKEGWEVAIEVLGRMDVPEKSEEMVKELLRDLIERLSVESGSTVDKICVILNNLGMITFAEETAEVRSPHVYLQVLQILTVTVICRSFIERVHAIWRSFMVLRAFSPPGKGSGSAQPAYRLLFTGIDSLPRREGPRPGSQ